MKCSRCLCHRPPKQAGRFTRNPFPHGELGADTGLWVKHENLFTGIAPWKQQSEGPSLGSRFPFVSGSCVTVEKLKNFCSGPINKVCSTWHHSALALSHPPPRPLGTACFMLQGPRVDRAPGCAQCSFTAIPASVSRGHGHPSAHLSHQDTGTGSGPQTCLRRHSC